MAVLAVGADVDAAGAATSSLDGVAEIVRLGAVLEALRSDTRRRVAPMPYHGVGSEIIEVHVVGEAPHEAVNTHAALRLMVNAKVFRFDASDLMPAQVGAGTFWTGIVDWVGGKSLDAVLSDIQRSWPK